MRITPLVGTIKTVALHSGVSHHLFESEDGGKREQDTRNSNNIYYQSAEEILLLRAVQLKSRILMIRPTCDSQVMLNVITWIILDFPKIAV